LLYLSVKGGNPCLAAAGRCHLEAMQALMKHSVSRYSKDDNTEVPEMSIGKYRKDNTAMAAMRKFLSEQRSSNR
jgi:hypothetical protein